MPRRKKTPEEHLREECAKTGADPGVVMTEWRRVQEAAPAVAAANVARAKTLLAETTIRPRVGFGGGSLCDIQDCLRGHLPQRLARSLRMKERALREAEDVRRDRLKVDLFEHEQRWRAARHAEVLAMPYDARVAQVYAEVHHHVSVAENERMNAVGAATRDPVLVLLGSLQKKAREGGSSRWSHKRAEKNIELLAPLKRKLSSQSYMKLYSSFVLTRLGEFRVPGADVRKAAVADARREYIFRRRLHTGLVDDTEKAQANLRGEVTRYWAMHRLKEGDLLDRIAAEPKDSTLYGVFMEDVDEHVADSPSAGGRSGRSETLSARTRMRRGRTRERKVAM